MSKIDFLGSETGPGNITVVTKTKGNGKAFENGVDLLKGNGEYLK